jgi:endo-1,4-beta-xylanase
VGGPTHGLCDSVGNFTEFKKRINVGKQPKFSVVIPTYNRCIVLQKAIDSVLVQTFKDFELIIVDDGSTDNTKAFVSGICDVRLRYIYQKNSGGSKARNAGIDAADGEYIAFLDSDDQFVPTKLERVFEELTTNKADVYSSYIIVDRGNGITGLKPSRPLRKDEPVDEFLFCACETISTCTLIVRNTIAKKVRFMEGLRKGQDLDFSVRLYWSDAKFHFIDEPLSIWSDQTSKNRVSHGSYGGDFESWLIKNKANLSHSAYYGFRANILSYEIAKDHPIKATIDMINGYLFGRTSFRRLFHSAARAFIPRSTYRRMVDTFLKAKNKSIPKKSLLIVILCHLALVIPDSVSAYKGREIDADWRRQADQRIELYRKAELTVKVLNNQHEIMKGVTVHARMTKHDFAFGAAVGAHTLMNTGKDSDNYRNIVLRQYNKVVLENDLKWDPWNSSKTNLRGSKYYYPQTLAALQWLKEHSISIRGHYLSWGPVEKLGAYKKFKNYPESFRQELYDHIREKIIDLGDLVDEWDGINHPIGWNENLLTLDEVLGKSIYIDILKLARELKPRTHLYINEGNILPDGKFSVLMRDKYEKCIRYLRDNGAPLDGIGLMGHFTQKRLTAPVDLYRILDRFASLGLPLQVTEFDIRFAKPEEFYNFSDEELQLQADYTRDFMTVMFSHPAVVGIVMWGFWEGHHYHPSAALYKKDWSIKPNGSAWNDLVFKKWWTDEHGQSNQDGLFSIRGFLGDYEIEVYHNGKRIIRPIKLAKDGLIVEINL